MAPDIIEDRKALAALADRIMGADRRGPIVVLSVTGRDRHPGVDPERLCGALEGTNARIVVLADPWYGGALGNLTGGAVALFDGMAALCLPDGRVRTFPPNAKGARKLTGEARRAATRMAPVAKTPAARPADPIPDPKLFPPSLVGEWLRLAVRVEWALMIGAQDKEARPLPDDWRADEGFVRLMAEAANRDDLLRCMVRVLLGLDERHALHDTAPGGRVSIGAWGSPVWRAAVKQGSPDAWRMHYTTDDKGCVVFLSAGGHDRSLRGA